MGRFFTARWDGKKGEKEESWAGGFRGVQQTGRKEKKGSLRGEKVIHQLGEAFDRGGEMQQSPCSFQLERSLSRKL